MEIEDVEAAIAQADELLKHESPFNRHEKDVYSKIARSAFENVRKARADGFSFVQICAAYEKAGLLPCKARSHSFRQAFYRERERQKKDKELSKRISDYAEAEKKTVPSLANPEEKKPEVKVELGRTVNTGTGKVIKKPDGGFEY